jgi:hypothetical protein
VGKTERDVYICATYYHILIAAIKGLRAEEKPDIVICDLLTDDNNCEAVANNIRCSQIFRNVTVFPELKIRLFLGKGRIPNICWGTARHGQPLDGWEPLENLPIKHLLADHILIKKAIKEFQLNEYAFQNYRNVYAFADQLFASVYLRYTKTAYHIIEDGLDHYKNVFKYCTFSYNKTLREKILSPLLEVHYIHGKSKYTKSVEVNDAEGIVPIPPPKVHVQPKAALFSALHSDEKQKLLRLFTDGYDFSVPESLNCILLLTSPFVEDGLLATQEQQIQLFREVLNTTCGGGQTVILKPHPRDFDGDIYREAFAGQNVIVMEKNIPVEVLLFLEGVHFAKSVTVLSTALAQLDFVEEKISLGFDWLNAWKERNGA